VEKGFLDGMPKIPYISWERVPRLIVVFLELKHFFNSAKYGFVQWVGVRRFIFVRDAKVDEVIS
jgi:hypothetical protein